MSHGAALSCTGGHEFSIDGGVVDLLVEPRDDDVRKTLESFGYEWTTFSDIHSEDQAFWETYYRDVPLEELTEVVALDAGCGKGRFTRFTAAHVREIVALDGSDAIVTAASNLADLSNATFIRGDLLNLPFGAQSFGFIGCLGVLHHLPDPVAGLKCLVRTLKPEAPLLLYLYSRPTRRGLRSIGLAGADRLRRVTVGLPRRLLRVACVPLAVLLYLTLVLPGLLGERLGNARLIQLPLATYRGKPVRSLWLDTFDRLSAPLEHRYTRSELESLLREAGLEIVAVREEAGWFVVARQLVTG